MQGIFDIGTAFTNIYADSLRHVENSGGTNWFKWFYGFGNIMESLSIEVIKLFRPS
jgi:hypothetical protein